MLKSIDRLWRHNHIYVRKPVVLEHMVLNSPYVKQFAGKDNYSYVGIWDGETVVGLGGAVPQKINVFGKNYSSMTGSTWIIDENYKMDGMLYWDLVFSKSPHMIDCIGLSPIAYKIYKMMGFSTIENMPRWIGIHKLAETKEYLLPKGQDISYLPQMKRVDIQSKYCLTSELDEARWNAFYQKKFAPITIGTIRDYEFLHWRYEDEPVLNYHIMLLEDSAGDYHGLAVVRKESIMDGKFVIGRILEFIAVEADAAVELANAVLDSAPEALMWDFYCLSNITAFGLEAVGMQCLPDWLDKVMMPTRFQPVDFKHMQLNLAIWLSDEVKKKLQSIDGAKWYLTKGDADQDRAN